MRSQSRSVLAQGGAKRRISCPALFTSFAASIPISAAILAMAPVPIGAPCSSRTPSIDASVRFARFADSSMRKRRQNSYFHTTRARSSAGSSLSEATPDLARALTFPSEKKARS